MKRLASLLVGTALLMAAPSMAQDNSKPAPNTPGNVKPGSAGGVNSNQAVKPTRMPSESNDAWMKAAEAGPEHKALAQFVGEWEAAITHFAPPGATEQPAPAKGTEKCKMELGGRFISSEFDSQIDGKPFRGLGTVGYNNLEKRYEATWIENKSTGTMFMIGKFDADGKVLTFTGETPDPVTGGKTTMKEVITITDKNSHKSEFYMVMNGKDIKMMEIAYTRKTGAEHGKDIEKAKAKGQEKPTPAQSK